MADVHLVSLKSLKAFDNFSRVHVKSSRVPYCQLSQRLIIARSILQCGIYARQTKQ